MPSPFPSSNDSLNTAHLAAQLITSADVNAIASAINAIETTVVTTPAATKVPLANGSGKLAAGWISQVIASSDLTDGGLNGVQLPAFAASITPDFYLGGTIKPGVLTANIAINAPINGPWAVGTRATFVLKQDSTGGRTITWNAAYVNTPISNVGANAYTISRFVYDGTTWVGQDGGGAYTNTGLPFLGFKDLFEYPLVRGHIPAAAQLTTNAIAGKYNWPTSIKALSVAPTSLATQLSGIANGTQLRILPGVYREAAPNITATNVRLYAFGDVAISGMDDWSTSGAAGNVWAAAAAPNAATSFVSSLAIPTFSGVDTGIPGGVITNATKALPEQVMLDGVMYNRVAAGSTLAIGQFMLDGSRHVVVRPPTVSMAGRLAEVTTRQSWLTVSGSGLTLDGIYLYGAPSGANTVAPLQQNNQANFTIRNCMIGWTHGIAVALGGAAGASVADTVFHNIGTAAVATNVATGATVAGCVFFNCGGTQNTYSGALDESGYDPTWGSCGIKFAATDYGHIRNNVAWNMGFSAYWHDVLCRWGSVVDNVCWDYRRTAIQYEVSSYFSIYGNHIFQTLSTPFTNTGLPAIVIFSSRDGDVGPDLDAGQTPNVVMHCPVAYKMSWDTARTDLPPSGTNNAGSGGFKFVRLHDNIAILRKTGGQGPGGPDQAIWWSDIVNGYAGNGVAINDASNTGWHNLIGFENATHSTSATTWPADFILASDVSGGTNQQAGGYYYTVADWILNRWDTGTDVDARTHKSRYLTYAEMTHYLSMYGLQV